MTRLAQPANDEIWVNEGRAEKCALGTTPQTHYLDGTVPYDSTRGAAGRKITVGPASARTRCAAIGLSSTMKARAIYNHPKPLMPTNGSQATPGRSLRSADMPQSGTLSIPHFGLRFSRNHGHSRGRGNLLGEEAHGTGVPPLER
jgi:hypothetical protein